MEARLKELESKNSQLQKQVGDSKSASSAQVISRNSFSPHPHPPHWEMWTIDSLDLCKLYRPLLDRTFSSYVNLSCVSSISTILSHHNPITFIPNLWPFLCFSLNKIAEAQSQVKSLQDKVTQLQRENGELKSKASQVCEMRDSIHEFQVTMMNRII